MPGVPLQVLIAFQVLRTVHIQINQHNIIHRTMYLQEEMLIFTINT